MSIGDALAAARREAGLTITQVSQRTCIRETILRGIERGDFSACGGDFYARGHIRSIARVVGVDPEELVREYDATQAAPRQMTAADVFQPFTPVKLKERRRPNWSIVLLAGLIAVLGVAGFKYFGSSGSSASNRPAASTQPDHPHKHKATTTPVAQSKPTHIRITLVATAGGFSWAELTGTDGKVVFMGDVGGANGQPKKSFLIAPNATLKLGYPPALRIYVDGKRQKVRSVNPVTLTCGITGCA